jgi:hypothetical protein
MPRQSLDLTSLPLDTTLRSVVAWPSRAGGRAALRVELTDAARAGTPGVDFVDMPTFAVLPLRFRDGTISVDILARLGADAPDYARGFAGLAYRINADHNRFEAVYLRPTNGLKANPPPPRDRRAVQYFAYPDWKYERLRELHADGRYEAGADIGLDDWIRLVIHVAGRQVRVEVNGVEVLAFDDAKAEPETGAIGLFVDIGTEAYFSNLTVTTAEPV